MAKTVVSKSVQRRLAVQKAGKKPKPVKKAKAKAKPVKKVKVKPEPEPIESEQEVECDDTEYDGHEGLEAYDDLDEPEQEGA